MGPPRYCNIHNLLLSVYSAAPTEMRCCQISKDMSSLYFGRPHSAYLRLEYQNLTRNVLLRFGHTVELSSSSLAIPQKGAPQDWPRHRDELLRIGHTEWFCSSRFASNRIQLFRIGHATWFILRIDHTAELCSSLLVTPQKIFPWVWSQAKVWSLRIGHTAELCSSELVTHQSCGPQDWSDHRVQLLRIGHSTQLSSSGLVRSQSLAPQDWSQHTVELLRIGQTAEFSSSGLARQQSCAPWYWSHHRDYFLGFGHKPQFLRISHTVHAELNFSGLATPQK